MQRYRIKKQIMPSRKRNKGKDRKAKKEAERARGQRVNDYDGRDGLVGH